MEGRGGGGGRARGGQWRRGGGGAQDTGAVGERRGRGRGSHHRGRGRRDHYRGRGRGGAEGAAVFRSRSPDELEDKENLEDEMPDIYSRRKLESNWDRYEESEKEEVNDGVPVQRGTDYHVLLSSAGDSFTQFRFSEEKDWEMDSLAVNQVPALFVDLEALAQSLQELPLHQRLNLEPDLIQVTTPVELPSVGMQHRAESNVLGGFKPPVPAHTSRDPALGGPGPVKPVSGPGISFQASTAVTGPAEDTDKELDLLLGLQKPVTELSITESKTSNTAEVSGVQEKEASVDEKEEEVVEVNQAKAEEAESNQQKAEESEPKSNSVKQEMTEEDLEDWLDSMIS